MTTVSQVNPIWAYFNISESDFLGVAARICRESLPARSAEEFSAKHAGRIHSGQRRPLSGKGHVLFTSIARSAPRPAPSRWPLNSPIRTPHFVPAASDGCGFRPASIENALLVPQPAVIEVQSKYMVIVLTPDNKADFGRSKVGERVGPNWIITEGLKPGEKVVVEGIEKVQMFAAAVPQMAKEGIPVIAKPYMPAAGGRAGATDHVEILYQSAHRRDGHCNSDGAGRRGRNARACLRRSSPISPTR